MRKRLVSRIGGALAAACVLAVAACGSPPGGPAGDGAPPSTPAQQAASYSKVDGALVAGLTTSTYVDGERSIRAEVPVVGSARQMSAAVEVLRERALREASWANSENVTVDWRLISSGPGVLGVMVSPRWTVAGVESSAPSTVWYDAATKLVHSSPILIQEQRWGDFKVAVGEAAKKEKGVDQVRLSQALDSDPAPMGAGPMMGFDEKGNLLATFAAGAVRDDAATVVVPVKASAPFLSELGVRAQEGATDPISFDGTAPAQPSPTAAATAPPATNQVPRPSTAIGPDCRKLTCVALTYDDGPGPDTPRLVDSLTAAQAPATFFQLGQMLATYPEAGKAVASAGHEVGNHSWSHPQLTGLSTQGLQKELGGTSEEMANVYGRDPLLMRPPYGAHNKNVDQYLEGAQMSVIQWSVDTNDWKTRSAPATESAAVQGATAGAIILMHDVHSSTVDAAPGLLSQLKEQGVTLVTVSEMSLNSGGYRAGGAYCNGTMVKQNGFNCDG